ncbi:MAG: EscU/YscU/HrcU family type III secretion system export apparatus switch protein [Treponema sp.]|nr:EscU/YscU/HrcU family type III secretion system export apparatus switch protein [Treponema sp.]
MRRQAVALTYPEGAAAPFISACAAGQTAERVLAIAAEHGVPVVEHAGLVQVLSQQTVGDIVPEETWVILAKIFAFIMEKEKD